VLAELAKELGYQVVGRELFRLRQASGGEPLREELVLLRWPG
jgi:hypothetical protein